MDAPFGDRSLRFECVDHEHADPEAASEIWRVFSSGELWRVFSSG